MTIDQDKLGELLGAFVTDLGSTIAAEAAIRQVAGQAGFSRFRRAAETPFNAVFEAQP